MANVKLISPGLFVRGVLLGEFGVNNIHGEGRLNSVMRSCFDDSKGWSDQKLTIAFTPQQLRIPPSVSIWQEILDDKEQNLLLGGDLRESIRDLVFVNAYPCLTSREPTAYSDGIRIVNILLQHLVYFEKALQLPLTWQRLQ